MFTVRTKKSEKIKKKSEGKMKIISYFFHACLIIIFFNLFSFSIQYFVDLCIHLDSVPISLVCDLARFSHYIFENNKNLLLNAFEHKLRFP